MGPRGAPASTEARSGAACTTTAVDARSVPPPVRASSARPTSLPYPTLLQAPPQPLLRIGLVADVQYADAEGAHSVWPP